MKEEPKEPTLLDYWNIVYKARKFIITVTVSVTVLAAVVTLLLPKVYTASVAVLPPEVEDTSRGGSMMNKNMFSPYGFMIDGGYNFTNFMIAILKSRSMSEDVIAKFNLKKEEQDLEDAVKELNTRMKITVAKEKVVTLSVTTRDPKLSADIANFYIANLEAMNIELQLTQAKPMVRVLDKAIPPKKKSGPSNRNNVAIGFISSLGFCIVFVLLRENLKNRQT